MKMQAINIELTTECPLRCPQCYCYLGQGKHIDFEIAKKRIIEASEVGVNLILLSGGETLCYPHLYDLIKVAKQYCGKAVAAFSGVFFTQEVFDKLMEAGLDEICISLNGSSEAVNALTRDGYHEAITALELLHKNGYNNTTINWVMHSSNVDDFPNMIKLAEKYEVTGLSIIGVKPDSAHELKTLPRYDQLLQIKKILREYNGKVLIGVESCYSPLRTLVAETKLFGNMNVGVQRGCSAGLISYNINVDGVFSPCRHLDFFEKFDTTAEYLKESKIITKLREMEQQELVGKCKTCQYHANCKPCQAINHKLDGLLQNGVQHCSVYL